VNEQLLNLALAKSRGACHGAGKNGVAARYGGEKNHNLVEYFAVPKGTMLGW
jgi:hypothetical protein